MRRRAFVVAAAAVAAALMSAPAQASTIHIGSGDLPAVALDGSGNAYLAWNSTDGNTLYFCRLPVAATSCTPKTLAMSQNASAPPGVFVSGSTVQVVSNRCCTPDSQTLLFTSTDSGSDFGAPIQIGTLNPSGDAVAGPGAGISMITSALISSYYQRGPTDGTGPATVEVPLSSTYTYHGVIGIVKGRPVVVFDDLSTLAWTTTNGGDPNNGSSWAVAKAIGPGHDAHLANGPAGLMMVATGSDGSLQLRHFTGAGWSSPTTVSAAGGQVSGNVVAFAQAANGQLTLVWRTVNANPTTLVFSASTDKGATWSGPRAIGSDSEITDLQLADTPNGAGLAVWDNGSEVSAARHGVRPTPVPPRASFTYFPQGRLCSGDDVMFDARASTPGSAPIIDYAWHFADPSSLDADWEDGNGDLLPFTADHHTTKPFDDFFYGYFTLNRKLGEEVFPEAVAILGTHVTLTVTNADGLTSQPVEEVLPFRYPFIDFFSPMRRTKVPACQGLANVLRAPVISPNAATLTGNKVSVQFSCRSAKLCGGTVTLSTAAGARAAGAARTRSIVVGKAHFALARGEHRLLVVKLNKRGRVLARQQRLHQLRVSVTTLHLGPKGHGKTVSRVVSVRRR